MNVKRLQVGSEGSGTCGYIQSYMAGTTSARTEPRSSVCTPYKQRVDKFVNLELETVQFDEAAVTVWVGCD